LSDLRGVLSHPAPHVCYGCHVPLQDCGEAEVIQISPSTC
jgi:hypothetical protein